jgi:hypothetical protein
MGRSLLVKLDEDALRALAVVAATRRAVVYAPAQGAELRGLLHGFHRTI